MNKFVCTITFIIMCILNDVVQQNRQFDHQPGPERSHENWNAKSVSNSEIGRLGCNVPTALPEGFSRTDGRIAWVVKDTSLPKVLARQAVWIRYEDKKDKWFEVIETRHVKGIGLWDNVYPVLGLGYFRANLPMHSQIILRSSHHRDFLLLSKSLNKAALQKIFLSCSEQAHRRR